MTAAGFAPMWADWPEWRGPRRDGTSPEKNLPERWSAKGENLAWRAPVGGISSPVVFGGRVFLLNTVGEGEMVQERVAALDGDTGKLVWEYRWTPFLSDVPPHRAGWASPAVDPETGNVYAFGVAGTLVALSPQGKLQWRRDLHVEFGLVTTHGGRTPSPVVEQEIVVVSGISSGWGPTARAQHRFFAFDKKTGDCVYVSTPGGRPFDTTYAPPVVADVNGTRLFIAGGGDGTVHAIKLLTGEPVWKFEMSKRGVNAGAVLNGTTAYVSHSEENINTSEMGLLAAIDASAKGVLGKAQIKWALPGFQGGVSSPVIDGDRLLEVDNSANIFAFDLITGRQIWKQNLGTIQKASAVLGDGKIYVGTENGRFFILRPHQDRCEILSDVALGTPEKPEKVIASAAISGGRVFVVSTGATYCIGKKVRGARAPGLPAQQASGSPAHVQVVPADVVLNPGESISFRTRLFDSQGRFLREEPAQWSLVQLKGTINPGGVYTAAADSVAQAGAVKATAGAISGEARVRVIPPLDWSEDFEKVDPGKVPAHWINSTGKCEVRQEEGNRVLVKLADNPFTKRARVFMGPADWHDYSVQVDVRASTRRRQMGDGGVVAQGYGLTLFGNSEQLSLQSWQPETRRTVSASFPWKADAWYRVKLRVENLADGKVRALGKAWPAAEAEPAGWMVERIDPVGIRASSPGLYADAPFEVFFDNLKVTKN